MPISCHIGSSPPAEIDKANTNTSEPAAQTVTVFKTWDRTNPIESEMWHPTKEVAEAELAVLRAARHDAYPAIEEFTIFLDAPGICRALMAYPNR